MMGKVDELKKFTSEDYQKEIGSNLGKGLMNSLMSPKGIAGLGGAGAIMGFGNKLFSNLTDATGITQGNKSDNSLAKQLFDYKPPTFKADDYKSVNSYSHPNSTTPRL